MSPKEAWSWVVHRPQTDVKIQAKHRENSNNDNSSSSDINNPNRKARVVLPASRQVDPPLPVWYLG